jgi:uncharacterized peroxidase-related enzyme
MPRIAPIDIATAEPTVQATLAAVKAKIGMVPNLFSTLALAPAALNGYLALSDSLNKGTLSPRQREVVALALAQANGCQYCLSAHTLMGKGAGLSAEEILAARHGTAADPTDKAVAVLARKLVDTRGHASDDDLKTARDAGLTEGQIVEIVAATALNVLTNFMNNVAHTQIDFPKVDLALSA